MEPITLNIPVLALRGLTVFPHMTLTFDVERKISINALERAMEGNQTIFLVRSQPICPEKRISMRSVRFPTLPRSCGSLPTRFA